MGEAAFDLDPDLDLDLDLDLRVAPDEARPYEVRARARPLGWPGLSRERAGLEAFPARAWAALPRPALLTLSVEGALGVLRVGGARASAPSPAEVHFDAEEWGALVIGVEADRVRSTELLDFMARKRRDPSFRLTPEISLDEAQPDPEVSLSLGEVLARLRADLVEVGLIG